MKKLKVEVAEAEKQEQEWKRKEEELKKKERVSKMSSCRYFSVVRSYILLFMSSKLLLVSASKYSKLWSF